MTNMRKFAAALVLSLVLCLAIFSTGASAHRFSGFRQHVSTSAVAVARNNNFDHFGRFSRFGGFDGFLGGFLG
ncbi:MAG TPA: hypothetical protein VF458_02160, partial [Ktedonobacteraceae bacterium]